MTDTATPETGPVDAPASNESIADLIAADIDAGSEGPTDGADAIADELVKEAEGAGEADEAPETEDDATDPAEETEESEEEATQEEALEQADEPSYTVKVNGEERTVPLSELLNGYSRTEDYKAKTTAVAEERRAIEAHRASLDTELKAQYANQLEEATNLFAQYDPVLQEAQQINWEALKAQDPAAYVQAQDAVNARLTAIREMQQRAHQARGEAQQYQQQQSEQERAQRFDTAASEVIKAIPELADEAKFRDFAQGAIDHLRNEGFGQDEISDALDHRVLALADKARRWDAHMAAQKSLPEKRVVQKSKVKALTTDGGSRAPKPRFPANAERDRKGNWIAEQILSEL